MIDSLNSTQALSETNLELFNQMAARMNRPQGVPSDTQTFSVAGFFLHTNAQNQAAAANMNDADSDSDSDTSSWASDSDDELEPNSGCDAPIP